MIAPVGKPLRPISLSEHAAVRVLEHEIALDTVGDVVRRPFLRGDTSEGAHYACAMGRAHGKPSWITVIFFSHTGPHLHVATVYPGPPTPQCRGRLGSDRT